MRNLTLLTALFGTVFGGALVMPALGHWHQTGVMRLWPLVAGATLAIVAGVAALHGVRNIRGGPGRAFVAPGIIAAGAFYMVPLGQAFFRPQTDLMGWIFCSFLAVASVLFYGACLHFRRRSLGSTPVS